VLVKTVQHRLGHASASLTLNQYSHALPAKDAEAAQFIGNLFAPVPKADAHSNARKSA
jgi:integrase